MANIYELLDLKIEPREKFDSVEELKSAIEKKVRKLNQTKMGHVEAKAENAKKELLALKDTVTLADFENAYKEAYENTMNSIKNTIRFYPKEVDRSKIEKLAKNNKVTVELIIKRFEIKLKTESENNKNKQSNVEKLIKPKCYDKIDNNKDYLARLGKADLYEFINYDGRVSTDSLRLKSPAELSRLANELRSRFMGIDDVPSAGKKIVALCTQIFKDADSKKDYDYYLFEYMKMERIPLLVIDSAQDNKLEIEQGEVLVEEINKIIKDEERSRRLLRGYCQEKKIIWIESRQENSIFCWACGLKIGSEDKLCGHCRAEQFKTCKKCGSKSRGDSENCTNCGEKFGDSRKAFEYCNLAVKELNLLNFDVANHFLEEAEKEDESLNKIKEVRDKYHKLNADIGKKVIEIEKCKDNKEFFKARKLLNDITRMYPGYENEGIKSVIENAITSAKAKFDMINSPDIGENELLEGCSYIKRICRDYPGIDELVVKIPVDRPENIKVDIRNSQKMNIISWEYKKSSETVEFKVVRKEHSKPKDSEDGTVIGIFSGTSCTDSSPRPGKEYYYAIFALRGIAESEPLYVNTPVVNMYDIEDISVTTGDGFIVFKWKNPYKHTVKVYRKSGKIPSDVKDGEEIGGVTQTEIWDRTVANGTKYGYLIRTEIVIGNKEYFSEGISQLVVAEVPPREVCYLSARMQNSDNQKFELEYDDDIKDKIEFYLSDNILKWQQGASVNKKELLRNATPADVRIMDEGVGILRIGKEEEYYLTAVTVRDNLCVIGTHVLVTNRQLFSIKEIRRVHNSLEIFINKWPVECSVLRILYSRERFPQSYNDKQAENILVRKNEYIKNGALSISNIKEGNYYISVYGKLSGDAGYSSPVSGIYSNVKKCTVTYEMKVKRNLLRKITGVTLEFLSDCEFELPRLSVRKNNSYMPTNITSGKEVLILNTVREKAKKHVVDLGHDFMDDDYINIFFVDTKDGEKYELNAKGMMKI